MQVAVLKETLSGENRVALVPGDIPSLLKRNIAVMVEQGAGDAAGYTASHYEEKGAVVTTRAACLAQASLLATVRGAPDVSSQHTLVGFLDPFDAAQNTVYAQTGCTAFAMELMPRITRAQSMDALSSMANLAGYKAVLLAACQSSKMFPMMITAAGTLTPAKVFVLGAGVAGLQAIATAKRLGAVVEAYDVRPEVKEQVQSVGGKFVELALHTASAGDGTGYAQAQSADFYNQQQQLLATHMAACDIIITTAALPGRKAPLLIPAKTVQQLKPGAVVVDLAAETGGNCELTEAGQTVFAHGVAVLGPTNIASSIPYHASQLYSRNVSTFIQHLTHKDGSLNIDTQDEITRKTQVCQNGKVVFNKTN